jgi:hypothetical protein
MRGLDPILVCLGAVLPASAVMEPVTEVQTSTPSVWIGLLSEHVVTLEDYQRAERMLAQNMAPLLVGEIRAHYWQAGRSA